MAILFSAAKPSGKLHIGNYFGFVQNFLSFRSLAKKKILSVVDLHAMTQGVSAAKLKDNTINLFATLLACDCDPKENIIFIQSYLAQELLKLYWILAGFAKTGHLERMTQYKDKISNEGASATLGLFSYPVLMAADVLLFKADVIPVGADQKQHIEFVRDLAGSFNNFYGQEFFPLPNPLIRENFAKIKSLRDPLKKMRKSDGAEASIIYLCDEDDVIAAKVKKSASDSVEGFATESLSARPAAKNLIDILSAVTNVKVESLCTEYVNFSQLKGALADSLISLIAPIREKAKAFAADQGYMLRLARDGAERARAISCADRLDAISGLNLSSLA